MSTMPSTPSTTAANHAAKTAHAQRVHTGSDGGSSLPIFAQELKRAEEPELDDDASARTAAKDDGDKDDDTERFRNEINRQLDKSDLPPAMQEMLPRKELLKNATPEQAFFALADAARGLDGKDVAAGREAADRLARSDFHIKLDTPSEQKNFHRLMGRGELYKGSTQLGFGGFDPILDAAKYYNGTHEDGAGRGTDDTLALRATAGTGMLPTLGVEPSALQATAAAAAPAEHAASTPDFAPPPVPDMPSATLPMEPTHAAFAPALGTQLKVWMDNGVQQAQVELHPRDLGPIAVQISVDGGKAHVQLGADVESTRAALTDALPQLQAVLADVGLTLTGGQVSDQGRQQMPTPRDDDASAQRMAGVDGVSASSGAVAATNTAAAAAARRIGLLDLYA